jgi:hypothetical protein
MKAGANFTRPGACADADLTQRREERQTPNAKLQTPNEWIANRCFVRTRSARFAFEVCCLKFGVLFERRYPGLNLSPR